MYQVYLGQAGIDANAAAIGGSLTRKVYDDGPHGPFWTLVVPRPLRTAIIRRI